MRCSDLKCEILSNIIPGSWKQDAQNVPECQLKGRCGSGSNGSRVNVISMGVLVAVSVMRSGLCVHIGLHTGI